MPSESVAMIELYIKNLDRYTIEQLRANSTDDQWSIGQVYMHVIKAANEYIAHMEACAADTREVAEGKTEDGMKTFAAKMWPDVRVRLAEPPRATPNPESKEALVAELEQVLAKLHHWEDRLDAINPACKRRHGWFGWLNGREWFEMVGLHARHHLKQIASLDRLLAEQ